MKNKIAKIILGLLSAIGIFMGLGWSFFSTMVVRTRKHGDNKTKQLSHIKKNHPRNGYEQEYEDGKAWCKKQKMHDCYLKSEDGLQLHGMYFPTKDAKRIVLLSHGYKGSPFGDFAYISQFLHENGCDLFYIDQRCCGESEGMYITYGALERKDVVLWSRYIAERNTKQLPIYLYGESMGGAAVLMASGENLPKEVKGIIADCAFRSMKGQLQDMARNWFHLSWIDLLLFRVDLYCRLLGGFRMKDADTTYAMRTNKRPILFFHGTADTFVDPRNSLYNFAICKAPKELVMIHGARHLCSAYVEPERYKEKLISFFQKYDGR